MFGDKKYQQSDIPVGENHIIKVIQNDVNFVGKLYKKNLENPNHLSEFCGTVYTYFVNKPNSEDAVKHWAADMYVNENYVNDKEFGNKVGQALLKNTACKEPMLLLSAQSSFQTSTFSKSGTDLGYVTEFGKVYTE